MSSNGQQAKNTTVGSLGRTKYGYALSLIIYWEEGHRGFKKEGQKLGRFLKGRLGHEVQEFAIPHDSPHVALVHFISKAIIKTNEIMKQRECPALVIVHYGGHGHRNDDFHNGERERSVWAERAVGGITVDWFEIQNTLRDAKSDLLLLLDCCYALRASQEQLPPRSKANAPATYQLLAAASHDQETPLPGDRSFTNALIRRLQEHFPEHDASDNNWLTTERIFQEIKSSEDPKLQIQPCYHPFTEGVIWIGPIEKNPMSQNDSLGGDNTYTVKFITQTLDDVQEKRFIRSITLDQHPSIRHVEILSHTKSANAVTRKEVSDDSSPQGSFIELSLVSQWSKRGGHNRKRAKSEFREEIVAERKWTNRLRVRKMSRQKMKS